MATYKTGWMKKLINGVSTKIFAISHAKCTYWDYANSKTLADVVFPHGTVLTNENIDNITKPGIYYAESANSCSGLPPEYGSNPTSVGGFILFVVNSTTQIVFPNNDEKRTYIRSIGGKWFIIGGFGSTDNCSDDSLNIGSGSTASGTCSLAVGSYCKANVAFSSAFGRNVEALQNQLVGGHYNNTSLSTQNSISGTDKGTAFCIGNGTSSSKSNAFRVTGKGQPIGKLAYSTTGCDYAEYFEWEDGNPDNEDRRGLFVTLVGNKIKPANDGDYIHGIVSSVPAIIGNFDEDWMGRYLTDDFGSFIDEEIQETIEVEEDGKTVEKTITVTKWKENPSYNPDQKYVPRSERPEWSEIGMLGALHVIDDGTCEVNGFCKVANDGKATAAEWNDGSYQNPVYRVVDRVTDNIVKVIFR